MTAPLGAFDRDPSVDTLPMPLDSLAAKHGGLDDFRLSSRTEVLAMLKRLVEKAGFPLADIHQLTHIDPWFLNHIRRLVQIVFGGPSRTPSAARPVPAAG